MNLTSPECTKIRKTWDQLRFHATYGEHWGKMDEVFKVTGKGGKQLTVNEGYDFYIDPDSNGTRLAFKIDKSYWAKGRKMPIESKMEGIPSGVWLITYKAESNSYDWMDFVVVEYMAPHFDTPRKALNWLEKQIEELEAKDGITTDALAKSIMNK